MKRKTAIVIGWILLTGLLIGMILPALSSTTNCGGNSYALFACKQFLLITSMAAEDGKPDVSKFEEDEKSAAVRLTKSHWIGRADFLVRTNFTSKPSLRLVEIVCEEPFSNVPQPTLWNLYRENPAHAVGYSDGSTGLISPAEFKALDLSAFIHLSSLGTNISSQPIQP